MSGAPFQIDGNAVRWGVNLGTELKMRDALWDGLTDVSTLLGTFFSHGLGFHLSFAFNHI